MRQFSDNDIDMACLCIPKHAEFNGFGTPAIIPDIIKYHHLYDRNNGTTTAITCPHPGTFFVTHNPDFTETYGFHDTDEDNITMCDFLVLGANENIPDGCCKHITVTPCKKVS